MGRVVGNARVTEVSPRCSSLDSAPCLLPAHRSHQRPLGCGSMGPASRPAAGSAQESRESQFPGIVTLGLLEIRASSRPAQRLSGPGVGVGVQRLGVCRGHLVVRASP